MIKDRKKKERGKDMSLKKRMFRSNMAILFAALFFLMAVILLVCILFEDSLENQIYEISETKLESHVGEVASLIERENMTQEEELQKEIRQWGYQAALIAEGKVISGNDSEQMKEFAEVFHEEEMGGQTELFSYQKATVAGKYLKEQEAWLLAVHFPEKNWLISSLNDSFYIFLGAVILAGIAAILFLLFLASFFTRRMNQTVMEPLEQLVQGAQRIQKGNLGEPIDYHGEAEFEHVCQTFNDMQSTILKDREQRAKTEQARIDMITGISHDLRTPLTSIRGYIKGVLDNVAGTEEKRKAYLTTAYEATEEMNLLLQKLFDFSRMESGQMPFHMVKADLGEYVTSYVAQKETVCDPKKIVFHLHKAKAYFEEISIDIEQIKRIFDNLLENSRKYAAATPPVHIDISVKETEKELLIEWKDNGRGVPEEKLSRIFERFYRCDESRTEKGSGIGLYVVQYIMERHHGRVKAENDFGLKITLYFPKKEYEEAGLWKKY